MTPKRIVDRALEKGLDIIAVSDHNSAENLETALKVSRDGGITVLPAMEITTSEEAHLLAIFGSLENALKMQEVVYRGMPEMEVGNSHYQVVVNEKDEVMGFNKRFLMGAAVLSLGDLIDEIHGAGGVAIASHVDRGAFSVSSQFGFIPEGLGFDAFEVVDPAVAGPLIEGYPDVPTLCSSDAHNLDDIGKRTTSFSIEEASFEEIAMALRGHGGRHLSCD
jgi:predicted metal-dependent phosphoesterase TrpH